MGKVGEPAIREAVRRLIAAVQRPGVTVEVRRSDLELLLAARSAAVSTVPAPELHPEQR